VGHLLSDVVNQHPKQLPEAAACATHPGGASVDMISPLLICRLLSAFQTDFRTS